MVFIFCVFLLSRAEQGITVSSKLLLDHLVQNGFQKRNVPSGQQPRAAKALGGGPSQKSIIQRTRNAHTLCSQ